MSPHRDILLIVGILLLLVAQARGEENQWTLTLFLTPHCSYNEGAVKDIAEFLRRHPDIQGEGVLIAQPEEVRTLVPQAKALFGQGLTFSVSAEAAEEYGVRETPAFIFRRGGKASRISGRPDLERVWERVEGGK